MPWPLISVVIPAYNADRTIDRALASVFVQDYRPLEIIVIDDGSTDDTAERVASHRDRNVRLLRLETNRGVAAATNVGLATAKGEFIAFLDADDEWLPRKLYPQISMLMQNPDMSFVCSRWREVQFSGSVVLQPPDARSHDPCGDAAWRELLVRSFVLKSTVIARASHLFRTGGFDEALLVAEDQDMWIRLALIGKVGWSFEPSTTHYQTQGSLTNRYALSQGDFVLRMLLKHINAHRQELSNKEVRRILGTRYAQIGRALYQAGQYRRGLHHLFRSILWGIRPAAHLAFIFVAAPPVRWLKHQIQTVCREERPV